MTTRNPLPVLAAPDSGAALYGQAAIGQPAMTPKGEREWSSVDRFGTRTEAQAT